MAPPTHRRFYGAPPISCCYRGPVRGALYTTDEVAKLLRVSQRTVQEWIRSGTLTAVRYGRLLRIRQRSAALAHRLLVPVQFYVTI